MMMLDSTTVSPRASSRSSGILPIGQRCMNSTTGPSSAPNWIISKVNGVPAS
jgi:hypothetical protein